MKKNRRKIEKNTSEEQSTAKAILIYYASVSNRTRKWKIGGEESERGIFSFEPKEKQKTPFAAVKATTAN